MKLMHLNVAFWHFLYSLTNSFLSIGKITKVNTGLDQNVYLLRSTVITTSTNTGCCNTESNMKNRILVSLVLATLFISNSVTANGEYSIEVKLNSDLLFSAVLVNAKSTFNNVALEDTFSCPEAARMSGELALTKLLNSTVFE